MSGKSKRKLLFGLKVLAICGAAVSMVKGIDKLYADAKNEANWKENVGRVRVVCEIIPDTPGTIAGTKPQEESMEEGEYVSEEKQGELEVGSRIAGRMDIRAEDAYLLAKIAMAESEGEGVEGKALVIRVVLNRVQSDEFPDSIQDVIFQDGEFTPVSSGRFDKVEPDHECYEALELIQLCKWDESQGALYFESDGKSDWHRENLKYLFQYGNHYFYSDKELDGCGH